MKTKAFVRFLNRVQHYSADLELVDVFARSANKLATGKGYMFDAVSPSHHPVLSKRGSAKGSRTNALTHLKATLGASHIKDLYEDLSEYLRTVLTICARRGVQPARLVGSHRFEVDAKTLLELGSWDAIVEFVSKRIYRSIEEERSTKELVRKMSAKLGLNIDQSFIDQALPYLDARHLLVHEDGRVDEKYARDYPALGLKHGEFIKTDYQFVSDASSAIIALVREFDRQIVATGMIDSTDLQP